MESLNYTSKDLSSIFIHDPVNNKSIPFGTLFSNIEYLTEEELKFSEPKEKILIISSDIIEILSFLLAGWKLGLKIFICSPNLKLKEYKTLITQFKFKKVFTNIVKLKENLKIQKIDFTQVVKSVDSYLISYNPDDIALILFSSGTTGLQKAIGLSFNNITSNIRSFQDSLPILNDSNFLCSSPVWHAHGLYNSFITALFLKRSVIYSGNLNLFNSIVLLEYCKKLKNIIYHVTPSMLSILISASKRFDKDSLPVFQKVICGTSFLDIDSKKEFEKLFRLNIYQQYGMTEVLFISLNDSPLTKYRSVGKPLSIVDLEIWEGKKLSPNQTGRIRIKTPSYYGKYIKEPDIDSLDKGFFYTGDLGFIDDDGYLYITGREKDLIKKGGLAISAEKINSIIISFSDIVDVATISKIDSKEGEEIYSFIVANVTINKEDLKRHIKEHLSNKFIPKLIIQLNEIPTNEMGKISQKKLADLIKIEL